MTTSEKIKAAREKAGMTQGQVAARLGMKQSTYIKYENEQINLGVKTFLRIATALNIPPAELLTDLSESAMKDAPPPQPDFKMMRDKEILRWQLETLAAKSEKITAADLHLLVSISETMINIYRALAE